jgi:Spy/CpxP family protein refolding chaperone
MKRITLMLALFAFGFLVLGTTDASARWHRHGPGGGDGAGIGAGFIRSLDRMDLSVDQKRQVASVLKSHREEIAKEMTTAAEARAALRKAMHAPVYSDEDVRAAARTMATHHERMILLSLPDTNLAHC